MFTPVLPNCAVTVQRVVQEICNHARHKSFRLERDIDHIIELQNEDAHFMSEKIITNHYMIQQWLICDLMHLMHTHLPPVWTGP